MTPTEQDNELDLFSEEALKIAEALRSKYPNTWEILYNNHAMPEVIAFITADMKRVALEARMNAWKQVRKSYPKKQTLQGNAVSRLTLADVDRKITELKAQQEEVWAEIRREQLEAEL